MAAPRGAAAAPPAAGAGQPLPGPARPLRRASSAGRGMGAAGRVADRPMRACAVRGRSVDRRPRRDRDLRRRPGVTYFGIEDPSQALPELQHAHDAKHCRRCGAPYSYERAFVGHVGPLRMSQLRRRPPRARRGRDRGRAARDGRLVDAGADARGSPSRSSSSPASTTSTTRSPRSRPGCAPGFRCRPSGPALNRCALCSGASRRSRSPASRFDPLDQEPGGRQRGAADAQPGGRRLRPIRPGSICWRPRRLDRAERPHRRRPRRLRSGMPTSSCSPTRCAESSAPAPGRRRWRCASSTRAGPSS